MSNGFWLNCYTSGDLVELISQQSYLVGLCSRRYVKLAGIERERASDGIPSGAWPTLKAGGVQ